MINPIDPQCSIVSARLEVRESDGSLVKTVTLEAATGIVSIEYPDGRIERIENVTE